VLEWGNVPYQEKKVSRQKKFYLERRKPSGIYYYLVRDPVSRKTLAYKSTGTTDVKLAEAIGMEWWADGIPGKTQNAGVDRKTLFCDYLFQFWDFETSDYFREQETMGREPHIEHATNMQQAVDRHYRPYFKNTLLCQITEEALHAFIIYLKTQKHFAASTINSIRNASTKALRYAKSKKKIKYFDFDAVIRASGKSVPRGILENEEADRLFKADWRSKKSRIIAFICYHTGVRISEARSLKVSDIHPDRISVRHSWARLSKLKSTKNKGIRDIPILPAVYEEIFAYIKQMGLKNLDSLLAPGKKPEIPLDSHQIRDDFYKALANELGIDEETRKERNVTMNSFRHLLAKNIVEKGGNKTIGMKILGQKTSRIFDHYADHYDKETFRQMAKTIEIVSKKDTPKEPILFRGVG
jgi:integrase